MRTIKKFTSLFLTLLNILLISSCAQHISKEETDALNDKCITFVNHYKFCTQKFKTDYSDHLTLINSVVLEQYTNTSKHFTQKDMLNLTQSECDYFIPKLSLDLDYSVKQYRRKYSKPPSSEYELNWDFWITYFIVSDEY